MTRLTYRSLNNICVYCGSSDKVDAAYLQAAHDLGNILAMQGKTLIYGAGRTGLMGMVADGALSGGGQVIGVIPQNFFTPQLSHNGLTKLEIVDNMHMRKARMAELADAFIALPGGFGTFEELFEILTWAQIGLHNKPIGLLNIHNYFDPLLKMVEHALQEGFIYAEHRLLLIYDDTPYGLLDQLGTFQTPTGLERWVERDGE